MLLGIITLVGSTLLAQTETKSQNKPTREHFVGVQANALLRQLFNFGNNTAVNNPYLIKYSYRPNAEKRFELQAGFGYLNSQNTDNDGRISRSNQLDFRVGAFKKFKLSERFEAGLGFDLVLTSASIKSFNNTGFSNPDGTNFDSTLTETSSNFLSYGCGPQLNLTYAISKRVLLGTEASYYFRRNRNRNSVIQERKTLSNNVQTNNIINENEKTFSKGLSFTSPLVLFLIIKF